MNEARIKEFEEQINFPPYSSARTRRIIRQAVNEALEEERKKEFICAKCGIRKDSEHEKGDF